MLSPEQANTYVSISYDHYHFLGMYLFYFPYQLFLFQYFFNLVRGIIIF